MNYLKGLLIVVGFIFTIQNTWAEEIKVSLEPLPPLIIDKDNGLTVKLLKEIEKISDIKFKIGIRPYSRAKKELKDGDIQLMGHTPYQQETKAFYKFGKELKWSVATKIDVFAIKKENVDLDKFKTLPKIGTPRGNKEFMSELLEIPLKQFHEGSIENLLKMMDKGRIDVFLFERASTHTTIKKLKLKNVYYSEVLILPASLAVQNTAMGSKLGAKLDQLIKKSDSNRIFKDYLNFMNLPGHGVVSIR